MNQIVFIVNLAIALAGIYMAVESAKMKKTHKIAGQIYLSRDLQTRKCKKEAEYCDYVAPKGVITGILVAVLSGLAVAGRFFAPLAFFTDWSFVGILALYVWLISYSGKANKMFF